jgi:hypothetical protein|nr:MAG TPA: hypothetical protein [Caudoviricetes sp.]
MKNINNNISVSFECTELIKELRQDIADFGENLIVEVIATQLYGATIYKDYNFISDDENTKFELKQNEKLVKMPAVELLKLYEKENRLF